ncbi:MAG TPA: hypothetical protein P5013_05980 [Methanoregula sp.]|nr:hypothetical protein [Methanoregula sp.]
MVTIRTSEVSREPGYRYAPGFTTRGIVAHNGCMYLNENLFSMATRTGSQKRASME